MIYNYPDDNDEKMCDMFRAIIVGWIAWKGDNFLVIQFKYDLTISKFSNLKKRRKNMKELWLTIQFII